MKQLLQLTVNGEVHEVAVKPHATLVEVLRNDLDHTGTKQGCGVGECGACTVLIEGKAIYSCLTLAADVVGKKITTIEGLTEAGKLDPIQEAFVEHGALQCGYCIPGMVLSAKALLIENPLPSQEDIKFALAGNLCRCTGYSKQIDAVMAASQKARGK